MSPIICGTDFSDWAKAAQTAAAVVAAQSGSELWLVHVVEPELGALNPSARAQTLELLRTRLAAEAKALTPLAKRPVQTEVLHGRIETVLREFAHARRASMLVVGSAGHGGTPLARLGGHSERLASTSNLPVMVVRDDGVFQAWAAGEPLRVLLGVDESDATTSAVKWVERLRAFGTVDTVVGRVYYPDEAAKRYGLGSRVSFTEADPTLEALIRRDLKRRVPHLEGKGELSYRARLGVGRVADHLIELAEAERCSMLVVGTHRRSGLARMWSVSAASLHLARMAVVVVPDDGTGRGTLTAPPQLKRVLVTTDFSPLANSAVPWAFTLAQPGGEVFMTYVALVDPITGVQVEPGTPSQLEADVAARLRALTPAQAEQREVVARTEILRSPTPAKAICEAVERLGVDAIVMASHGRSGVARAVLGSVAEEVLRNSRRPVFIVRS